jgi:hypothetical protein
MNKGMVLFVVGALCLGACNVEHYDDCSRDDDFEFEDDFETGHRAGSTSKAGSEGIDDTGTGGTDSGGADGGGTEAGGASAAGAPPEPMLPPATPCDKERDCDAGFNCNYDLHECEPANVETCGEMEGEPECAERSDCIPVYGGINCSCGADCECQGGEPGCICESFEYLVCQPAE